MCRVSRSLNSNMGISFTALMPSFFRWGIFSMAPRYVPGYFT